MVHQQIFVCILQTSVAEEIPSLKTLVHQTRAEEMLSDQAWDLLGWTLQDNPFIVKSLENSQVDLPSLQ